MTPDPSRGSSPSLASLLGLLDDESPVVLDAVRRELARRGREARPALGKMARGGPPRARARARQLLLEQDRASARRRLLRYASRVDIDLERGLLLLDRFSTPGEDQRGHRKVLEIMGHELQGHLRHTERGIERAKKLVEYLSQTHGFAGPEEDYHHPDHMHFGRTLESKRGLPLTLCAVFASIARRAGLQAGLLPFPGHVLLRVADGGERCIIDAFGGGRILTETHCLNYLANHGLPYNAEWFRVADDRSMFLRQVLNLMRSLEGRGRVADRKALLPLYRLLAGPEASLPHPVPQRER